MKNCLLILFLHLSVTFVSAQAPIRPIKLKNGILTNTNNLRNHAHLIDSLKKFQYKNRFYTLIQFNKLPDAAGRKALSQLGINLFYYIPDNTYLAEISDGINLNQLKKNNNITGVLALHASAKISPALIQQMQQPVHDPDKLIAVSFYGNINKATVIDELKQAGAQIIETTIQPTHSVFIDASFKVIQKIATLPFVAYISSQSVKPVPLNYRNRATHAVNVLGAFSGRNLQGRNVTIGVGDAGDASTHIDLKGRQITKGSLSAVAHSTHVTGSIAGAGLINPKYKGMAPQATVINDYYDFILTNAPAYVSEYNMVLTNNSYGVTGYSCGKPGDYNIASNYVDEQLNNIPALLHVFAAGNNANDTICSPYPTQFATLESGYTAAKNVLTVGAINNSTYTIAGFSSCGPVSDGRLKPEITAGGWGITSTLPDNKYGDDWGTSMAAPVATGILGLLYERYRQLHGGSNPSSTLIKAVACNGAVDEGNPGPDYIYGFGNINARNSVEAIENNTYFTGSIANGSSATFTIPGVAPGTAQIKVLLYWNDPAAFDGATTALVNDLDLTVTTPDAILHRPLVLDPSPANVNNIAVEGVDNRNNIEQVVINNPPAGNFTITVHGTGIAQGPQDFVVVYQVIQPAVTVEYPFGNETLAPGEPEIICWNATDANTNTFTLEYTLDNGSTWTTIDNNVAAIRRNYTWTVPASAATGSALVRVSRNNTAYNDVSDYNFTILGVPAVTVNDSCQGYAALLWKSIPAATSYDVMMFKDGDMQVIASTTDTSYLVNGLNKDSTYWLAVRCVMGNVTGRRSIAQPSLLVPGGCTLPVLNYDVTPDSLVVGAHTGRKYTSSQLGTMTPQVHVTNLGNVAASGPVTISYQVNGGTPVTETTNINLGIHSNYTYRFSTAYDFSAPGTYTVKAWIKYSNDTIPGNDTTTTIIKQLQNDPVVLNPSYTEGFESATAHTYYKGTMGFEGLDRCDFNSSNPYGRARTFVNTGMARTGNRAITLDQTLPGNLTADSLIATFNLANYSTTGQVWLSLYAKNHGINFSAAGNKIWIRGSEQDAWIPVYALPYNLADTGVYRAMPPVNITETLGTASPAQSLSSSFQLKFGEEGYYPADYSYQPNGYTYDDVTFTLKNDAVGLMQVVNPSGALCSSGPAGPVTIKVKNYSPVTLSNVPVSYQLNNGTPVTENIASIAPFATINYTFTQPADLSALDQYNITAWAHYNTDSNSANDTITATAHTSPVITSYPYLEGFEGANNGYWYTGGANSSWQCGKPSGAVIKNAANGNKAWITGLNSGYKNNELSYLYSPCFDLSQLTQPVLSFSHIYNTQNNDVHWVEYSTDGQIWKKLGNFWDGVNWYTQGDSTWGNSNPFWQVASFDIPATGSTIRFRIVFHSNASVTAEGIGIDDVHIFDKDPIYEGDSLTGRSTHPLNGNNWIDFTSDRGFDPGMKLIASINPNGQNLGNTEVRVYPMYNIYNDGYQFYVARNIVIQSTNAPTAPVKIRYYFTDQDVQNIIYSTDCSTCIKLSSAYDAGITEYSNAPAEEDGSLSNNKSGTYHFIPPSQVDIIPYDQGYYAEFEVTSFSEFWISSVPPANTLPMEMGAFTVINNRNTALLQWLTYSESNTSRFIIERSTDGINYIPVGTVAASGNSATLKNYRFTDDQPATGKNYYRIKLIDLDGKISYSSVRTVTFADNNFTVSISPNPVNQGIVFINSTANCNRIELRDGTGRSVRSVAVHGMQTQLPVQHLTKGVYFLIVITDQGKKVEKLVIQ
ncbi:hypothetical protein A4D02_10030 [Niastella koreensis]|uniref:Peptidase S8 and S53 subtilisin kexin sedolisin n=2 Tax=Niastella koreensis TaxID=354356 RepID=G8TPP6_NIAKG|nr:S8 family serine peptidase [Niastella koreensis]AEV98879.1 peptidase S8 and S53 subtilisin kexin sedolisin [Niastella koreensis GR20-10]OQP43808.1 hypothetical protein A4D02_10030 [Niastella koreensis]